MKQFEKMFLDTYKGKIDLENIDKSIDLEVISKDIEFTFDASTRKEARINVDKIVSNIINEENDELCAVYVGELKEKIVYGNDVSEGKWVSIKELENYDLAEGEKEKILYYVN